MTESSGVLDKSRSASGSGKERKYYSLVEVAQKTGIPMPILLRYKREHPDRVPSEGSGSQQRFPEEAFDVLREIQQEEAEDRDVPRRGGFGLLSLPRLRRNVRQTEDDEPETAADTKAASEGEPSSRGAGGAGSAPSAEEGELLSLVDVSKRVDIPYPTLARYASQHGDRIPHQGKGRARRFPPEAIEVFQQIRKESKPGRPPKAKKREAAQADAPVKGERRPAKAVARAEAAGGAEEGGLAGRIATLEEAQKVLDEQVRDLIATLSKPAQVTVG